MNDFSEQETKHTSENILLLLGEFPLNLQNSQEYIRVRKNYKLYLTANA